MVVEDFGRASFKGRSRAPVPASVLLDRVSASKQAIGKVSDRGPVVCFSAFTPARVMVYFNYSSSHRSASCGRPLPVIPMMWGAGLVQSRT
jgi:hypothetical protein